MKTSIGSDAVKMTASRFVTLAITTVTAMLLSRFLTLEEYGTYSQVLMVTTLVTAIFSLGLPNSLNFFLAGAETKDGQQGFLSVYYTINTLLGFISGLVLVLSTPLIVSYFDNGMIKSLMFVLAVYPWSRIILAGIDNIFVVYGKITSMMAFRVANSLFILSGVFAVRLLDLSFITYMGVFLTGEALFALGVYVVVIRATGKIRFSLDMRLIKDILRFSIPIGLASVVGTLSIELDKLMIGRFYTTKELAIYTNGSRELPVSIIASSLTAVLMPQLVRLLKSGEKEKAVSLWKDATVLAYIFICFLSAGFFTFAPEVMTILYSEKFLDGLPVFRIYNLVLLLRCTYFGIILNSTGKTRFIFYSSIISLVLNVILNYLFYLIFGFIGPAIATLASLSLIALLQLIYTSKTIKVSFGRIFPWKSMFRITCLNAAFGIAFYCLKRLIPLEAYAGEIVESVFLGAVWGCFYLLLAAKAVKRNWKALKY